MRTTHPWPDHLCGLKSHPEVVVHVRQHGADDLEVGGVGAVTGRPVHTDGDSQTLLAAGIVDKAIGRK